MVLLICTYYSRLFLLGLGDECIVPGVRSIIILDSTSYTDYYCPTWTDTAMPMAASSAQRYLKTNGTATTSMSPPLVPLPMIFLLGNATRTSCAGGRANASPFCIFDLARLSSSSASALHTRQYSPDGPFGFGISLPMTVSPNVTLSYPRVIRLPHVRHTHAVE